MQTAHTTHQENMITTAIGQVFEEKSKEKNAPSLWKLNRLLAYRSSYSRRGGKSLILEGRVSVNGHIVQDPSVLVSHDAVIKIDGSTQKPLDRPRLWLSYKPRGDLVSRGDPQGRACFFDRLPKKIQPLVVAVGRLDINSEGLLLLTNHGMIARKLEDPKHAFIRCYRARVFGAIPTHLACPQYKKYFVKGELLGPAKIRPITKSKPSKRTAKHLATVHNHWLEIHLKSGRYREVRRLLEHFGLRVNRLIRTSYGPFFLNNLQPGEICEVREIPRILNI